MNYLIHATPVHPSLCLQYFILLFTIATITAFILLLLLLFCYYHHYKTVATDKPLRASLFPGAAELTTHLLGLINILWLPLCRINKFRFYFPRRLLRSPILVGHQGAGRTEAGVGRARQIGAHPDLAVALACSPAAGPGAVWAVRRWPVRAWRRHLQRWWRGLPAAAGACGRALGPRWVAEYV
jgi:hypothetical protein